MPEGLVRGHEASKLPDWQLPGWPCALSVLWGNLHGLNAPNARK